MILRGLLSYRDALRQRGISTGFQWLNGSFMEHKESLEMAPPQDVDVVTFFDLPAGLNQQTFAVRVADLFDPATTRPQYYVDAYPYVLGQPMSNFEVRIVSYWYGMWSHRRNGQWKGFVQVDISAEEDNIAGAVLAQIEREKASR